VAGILPSSQPAVMTNVLPVKSSIPEQEWDTMVCKNGFSMNLLATVRLFTRDRRIGGEELHS
jgi:hypothetical protein